MTRKGPAVLGILGCRVRRAFARGSVACNGDYDNPKGDVRAASRAYPLVGVSRGLRGLVAGPEPFPASRAGNLPGREPRGGASLARIPVPCLPPRVETGEPGLSVPGATMRTGAAVESVPERHTGRSIRRDGIGDVARLGQVCLNEDVSRVRRDGRG